MGDESETVGLPGALHAQRYCGSVKSYFLPVVLLLTLADKDAPIYRELQAESRPQSQALFEPLIRRAIARGEDLPVTLFVGGPPALILAAIAPLPQDVP